ncbi:MAG: SEC-C metal-binding domain-containing protein [Nitrospiraceae bacterium]|nr:SEC-C metal-binding domain-containing protein [Nitrospiraceae bacterium]
MNILPPDYCGDDTMEGYLDKAGSRLSIFGLYGLLFGCLAAPRLVMPSTLMPEIFGKEGANFETMEQAQETMGNIMALWNYLNGWDSDNKGLPFPGYDYPQNREGALQRIAASLHLADSFFEGLALGGINSETIPEGLKEAAGKIEKAGDLLYEEARLLEEGKELGSGDAAEVMKAVEHCERVIDSCIMKIHNGLKEERMRAVQDLRAVAAAQGLRRRASSKVGRNDPCPCGSGKKYKRCCGLIH